LRPAREAMRRAIAPEVIARLTRGECQAVTGRKRSFRVRSAGAGEDEHVSHVDERKGWHSRDYVAHQQREAFGVVDHAFTRTTRLRPALRTRVATGERALEWTGTRTICLRKFEPSVEHYNERRAGVSSSTTR